MRISDWSSDVCSSDLGQPVGDHAVASKRHSGAKQRLGQPGVVIGQIVLEPVPALAAVLDQKPPQIIPELAQDSERNLMVGVRSQQDRKSTRLTPVTNAQLVCRLLLEKKK